MQYKTLFTFFSICIYLAASAQPVIKKQKVIGGNLTEYFSCMSKTPDGGLIIGGSSFSSASFSKSESNRGPEWTLDYWIVKLDVSGKILWDKTIGGSENDFLNDIHGTSDGGYILGGTSTSSFSGEKNSSTFGGSQDVWIVKLNSIGEVQWEKDLGTIEDDYFGSIVQTADNGYMVGAYARQGITGNKTAYGNGSFDFWMIKLDNNGNIEWDKAIGSIEGDILVKLLQTNDGGYIMGGTTLGLVSGDKTEPSRGGQDFWLVKTDANGNIQWNKTLGGADEYENFTCLQQTAEGGYIAGGLSASNISQDKSENSKGQYDYWLIKLNSSGAIEWDKTIGSATADYMYDVIQTSDGGYAALGQSYGGLTGDKSQRNRGTQGTSDYWVVKLDAFGNKEFDRTLGGNKGDQGQRIIESSPNNYIIGGLSDSDSSGDKTKSSKNGSPDYWILQLNAPSASNAITSNITDNQSLKVVHSRKFIVYPNPAKDILHIQSNSKISITITNSAGNVVLRKNVSGNDIINIANLPAGLYYLQNDKTKEIHKIVVIK